MAYIPVLILSIVLMLASILILLTRANRGKVMYSFVACQLLVVIWSAAHIMTLVVTNLGSPEAVQKEFCYTISYISICFVCPTFLLFSMYFHKLRISDSRGVAVLVYLPAVLNYIMLLTNGAHHLFYTEITAHSESYGVFFYVNAAVSYIYIGLSIILLLTSGTTRGQSYLISLAVGLPVLMNVLFVSGAVKSKIDITPVSFALCSLLILFATYRHRFLNTNSIALNKAFDSIDEAIMIYDAKNNITYTNESFRSGFNPLVGCNPEGTSAAFYEKLGESFDISEKSEKDDYSEAEITHRESGRIFSLKTYCALKSGNQVFATTVIINDITRYYELVENTKKLAEASGRLALEKDRNRIAQEAHDTVGHTLTMISSLMRLSEIEYSGGGKLSQYLAETEQLAVSGLSQLRKSINELKQDLSFALITEGLSQLAQSVHELEIDISVQGEDGECYAALARPIYETAREAVTNCLKYSGADRMDIVLKLLGESVELYIFDNGAGCSEIKESNGINGMRKRTEALGGTIRFASSEGNGFTIIMKVPLEHDRQLNGNGDKT